MVIRVNGLTERLTVTTDKYKCNAKLGALAGDGGHGGCGGVGGRPGIYSIIGLKNSPEIEVFKYTGKTREIFFLKQKSTFQILDISMNFSN